MKSTWLRHGDASIHIADYGGSGPTAILCHGLGGSHANFAALGPLLAERMRVVAIDLPGFGLSAPGSGCDMPGFHAAIGRLLEAIRAGEIEDAALPVLLLGNSMGGAVSILAAGEHARDIERLVLVCPALPIVRPFDVDPRFALLIGSAMLPGYDAFLRVRLRDAGPEALVHDMLNLTCADKTRVPRAAIAEMIELAKKRSQFSWMASSFSSAARSIARTLLRQDTFRAAMRAVRAPVLLVQGDRDRLVPISSARAALDVCPQWTLEVYEGVGHVPQLETPERLKDSIFRFLERSFLNDPR